MRKKKIIRLGGFIGALCASAALVGFSASATGAYFTDSHAASLTASSGHLKLNVTGSTALNFANLMPGTPADQQISYSTSVSSGGVDLWMVFNPNGAGYQTFTGGKGSTAAPGGGLGRYGFFKVSDSNGGQAFVSGNLAYPDGTNTYDPSNMCQTDPATGRGGSPVIAETPSQKPPWCGVPAKILLASNLADNASGTVTVTFGLNGVLQQTQNQAEGTVDFTLVATPHGIAP